MISVPHACFYTLAAIIHEARVLRLARVDKALIRRRILVSKPTLRAFRGSHARQ
jgi:hypothetical protein